MISNTYPNRHRGAGRGDMENHWFGAAGGKAYRSVRTKKEIAQPLTI